MSGQMQDFVNQINEAKDKVSQKEEDRKTLVNKEKEKDTDIEKKRIGSTAGFGIVGNSQRKNPSILG